MTRQRIAITGSSGLIGGALSAYLRERGDEVIRIVRRRPAPPFETRLPAPDDDVTELASVLRSVDAVVNLAGAGIADHRWTEAYKRSILDSRVQTTTTVVQALAQVPAGVRLVSASGISIYGDRGDEVVDESTNRGTGFLADVVEAWEGAASVATTAGHSVAFARTGMVLSTQAGAFPRLALPARFGLGGPLGSGQQWWSWISLRDEVRAYAHLIDRPDLCGPVNLVAPRASRQSEIARALGRSLRRPAVLPVPAVAVRTLLGEMSSEVLASTRVRPVVLRDSGFTWMDANQDQLLDRLVADR